MAKQITMTEDAVYTGAAEIGSSVVSDRTVFLRFFLYEFETAVKVRTEKLNFTVDKRKLFLAFDTPFRAKSNGFRKPLEPTSITTWASAFGNAWDAGMFTGYDMAPYVKDIVAIEGSVSYTTRGSKLAKLMEKYPTTPPTADQWAAILTPEKKAKENPVLSYAKARVSGTGKAALERNEGELLNALRADPRKAAAFKAYRDACIAFEKAVSGEASTVDDLLAVDTPVATNGAQPSA